MGSSQNQQLQEWGRSRLQPSQVTLRGSRLKGGSHCKCGGNSKKSRIRSGSWSCDWIAATSRYTLMDQQLLLIHEQRKTCSRWNLLLVKMLWRLLKWLTPILKEVLPWENAVKQHCMLQRNHLWKETQLIWDTSLLSYKTSSQAPQPSVTTILISQRPSTSRQDHPPGKRLYD